MDLAQMDLILKILLAVFTLVGIIFAAGWWWATISKLVGSVEALHRRMTEDQTARTHRDEVVDALFMQIRLDIKGLQTWRSTLRFRPPENVVEPEGDQG